MMKNQMYAMGANGLLGYLARKAPVWAIGGSGKALAYAGKGLASGLGQAVMQGAAVGSGVLAARESRRIETGLEAI
jgi:hypothetical protein